MCKFHVTKMSKTLVLNLLVILFLRNYKIILFLSELNSSPITLAATLSQIPVSTSVSSSFTVLVFLSFNFLWKEFLSHN